MRFCGVCVCELFYRWWNHTKLKILSFVTIWFQLKLVAKASRSFRTTPPFCYQHSIKTIWPTKQQLQMKIQVRHLWSLTAVAHFFIQIFIKLCVLVTTTSSTTASTSTVSTSSQQFSTAPTIITTQTTTHLQAVSPLNITYSTHTMRYLIRNYYFSMINATNIKITNIFILFSFSHM